MSCGDCTLLQWVKMVLVAIGCLCMFGYGALMDYTFVCTIPARVTPWLVCLSYLVFGVCDLQKTVGRRQGLRAKMGVYGRAFGDVVEIPRLSIQP
jgi:hypothetical protein